MFSRYFRELLQHLLSLAITAAAPLCCILDESSKKLEYSTQAVCEHPHRRSRVRCSLDALVLWLVRRWDPARAAGMLRAVCEQQVPHGPSRDGCSAAARERCCQGMSAACQEHIPHCPPCPECAN